MGRRRRSRVEAQAEGFAPRSTVVQLGYATGRPKNDPVSYVLHWSGSNDPPTGRLVNVGVFNNVVDYRGSFATPEEAREAVRSYLGDTGLTVSKAGRIVTKR